MKKLLFILLLLPFVTKSQVWQQNNIEYGYQYKGLKTIRAFGLPKIQTTAGQGRDTAFVYYNTGDSSVYVWTGSQWKQIGSNIPAAPPSGYGLIQPGQVIWSGTGLKFYITAAKYYVNGRYIESLLDSVTLSTADATNPRFDKIGLDTTGHAFKITGTAAATPLIPQGNPVFQLDLTSVLINAGATTPSQISNLLLYDENVGPTAEWDASTHSASVNPASTAAAFSGSKSIKFDNAMFADVATVVNSTGIKASNYTTLYFRLKLQSFGSFLGSLPPGIVLRVNYGFSFPNGVPILLKHGTYGLDTTNTTDWQNIAIPLDAFQMAVDSITSIMFVAYNGSMATYYIDNINLQGGVVQPTGNSMSFNGRTGTVVPFKADYAQWFIDTMYRRSDSVFALKNGVELFQFKDSVGAGGGIPADTSLSINNRINTKLNISDTANIRPRLYAGSNVTITGTYPNLTIASTGGGGGSTLINGAANLGSGAQIFKDTGLNKINLRSIVGGTGISTFQNSNDITFKADTTVLATKWYSQNNLGYDTNRTGTYAQRISAPNPYVGYQYYQTNERIGLWIKGTGSGVRSWSFIEPQEASIYGNANGLVAIEGISSSGTGSSAGRTAFQNTESDLKIRYPAGIRFVSGTVTNAYAGMWVDQNANTTSMPTDTNYVNILYATVIIPTPPNGSEDYLFKVGVSVGASLVQSASDNNGFYFKLSNSSPSGNIECVTMNVTSTSANSGVSAASLCNGNPHTLVIHYNPIRAVFYIDGLEVANITTTIPPSLITSTAFSCVIRKLSGSTSQIFTMPKWGNYSIKKY